ncbi:hypothetical protein LWI28_010249 [Acer negundo]|uniref:DUF4283 domain-containing protein n=1 Tax=Acer negundo TaxID=4023 RepID=A0AAD5J4T5_ACENE|nr:hypothetical protein LWI28_010249 [Acer negundo]
MVAKPNPLWFTISGLPLHLWNITTFQKLGSILGNLSFIEEETLLRRRMDRARLLVAIIGNCRCPKVVKIKDGSRSFPVQIVKDFFPVDFLDLNFEAPAPKNQLSSDGTESHKSCNSVDKRRKTAS